MSEVMPVAVAESKCEAVSMETECTHRKFKCFFCEKVDCDSDECPTSHEFCEDGICVNRICAMCIVNHPKCGECKGERPPGWACANSRCHHTRLSCEGNCGLVVCRETMFECQRGDCTSRVCSNCSNQCCRKCEPSMQKITWDSKAGRASVEPCRDMPPTCIHIHRICGGFMCQNLYCSTQGSSCFSCKVKQAFSFAHATTTTH